MKYVSIDIETTGVDTKNDQILSIGLVIEDTKNILPVDELPFLHIVIIRERLEGNVFALDMNRDIIKLLRDYSIANEETIKILSKENNVIFRNEEDVVEEIFDFLYINGMANPDIDPLKVNVKNKYGTLIPAINNRLKTTSLDVAGKNFGTFDKLFLERLPRWQQIFRIKQRIFDPAILFIDWLEDTELPNLNKCMIRAGVDGTVTHDAVQDAKDVIRVLRTKY